jgi:hypothetical protein
MPERVTGPRGRHDAGVAGVGRALGEWPGLACGPYGAELAAAAKRGQVQMAVLSTAGLAILPSLQAAAPAADVRRAAVRP